jgi:hypothetical protein
MQRDKATWLREWLVPPIVLPILIGLLVASVALFRWPDAHRADSSNGTTERGEVEADGDLG